VFPHLAVNVFVLLRALLPLGREWTTKEIDPTNNETPYDGKGRPPNTDVIKPPNTDVFSCYLACPNPIVHLFSSFTSFVTRIMVCSNALLTSLNALFGFFLAVSALVLVRIDRVGRVHLALCARSRSRVAARPRQKRHV